MSEYNGIKRQRLQQLSTIQALTNEFSKESENLENLNFGKYLERLDANYDSIDTTNIAKEDAYCFKEISTTFSHHLISSVKASQKIDANLFLTSLKARYPKQNNDEEFQVLDWFKIGQKYNYFFHGIPNNVFFSGCFNLKELKKKVRKKRLDENRSKYIEEKPEISTNFSTKLTQSHHERMQIEIHKLIQEKPRNMMHLLVNPYSFTQTVENFFEFSFLVRDFSKIILNNEHLPVIYEENLCESELKECDNQSILTFNMLDWSEAIDAFFEGFNPIMPHRNDPIYHDS